jgi:hypothetical protein
VSFLWIVAALAGLAAIGIIVLIATTRQQPQAPPQATPSARSDTAEQVRRAEAERQQAADRQRAADAERQRQQEAERQRAELTDREQRAYYAAKGNLDALRAYLSNCSVCAFATEARTEISRLVNAEQEERAYNASRGNKYALQAYVNTCTVCTFASAARSEISKLDQPVVPCGGNADYQVIRPIQLLYQAMNQRDLALYEQQWADGATSRDMPSGGQVKTKDQKIETKRKQFDQWQFNIAMDHSPEIINKTSIRADISVYYSISITFTGGECRRRTGVLEKYTVTCGAAGQWQIIDNTDEINVSGSANRC